MTGPRAEQRVDTKKTYILNNIFHIRLLSKVAKYHHPAEKNVTYKPADGQTLAHPDKGLANVVRGLP